MNRIKMKPGGEFFLGPRRHCQARHCQSRFLPKAPYQIGPKINFGTIRARYFQMDL